MSGNDEGGNMSDTHEDRGDESTGDEHPEHEDAGDTETAHRVTIWIGAFAAS
jgi:hypothetical protein